MTHPDPLEERRLEAAARAICELRSDDWDIPDDRLNSMDDARAALAAADALGASSQDAAPAAPKCAKCGGAVQVMHATSGIFDHEAALGAPRSGTEGADG